MVFYHCIFLKKISTRNNCHQLKTSYKNKSAVQKQSSVLGRSLPNLRISKRLGVIYTDYYLLSKFNSREIFKLVSSLNRVF